MDNPLVSALNMGFKAALPIGAVVSFILALPIMAMFHRYSASLTAISIVVGAGPGLLLMSGGNSYWGTILLSYGATASTVVTVRMYGQPSRES